LSEHFSDREFFCPCADSTCAGKRPPHPALPLKLEVIRQLYGRPVIVNSGVRCAPHNARVGGVAGSEHETGEGADLMTSSSTERMELIRAAVLAGIRRIGVGKTFVHIGVSRSHPQDVIWLYP
jgi:hypothetical protein